MEASMPSLAFPQRATRRIPTVVTDAILCNNRLRLEDTGMAGRSAGIRMIEIAANLTDDMFKGIYHGKQVHPPDLPAVLARAWEAGVERIIVTGGSLSESREALALAETDVFFEAMQEFEAGGNPEGYLEELGQLARDGKAKGKVPGGNSGACQVVAIGECGLDYDRLQFCPAETQKRWFEAQFALAESTSLPMFLHLRAAADDFLDIVDRNSSRFGCGVVHSFTGSAEERDRILANEKLFLGVNGCSLKTAENLDAMDGIPLDRLLIETDSPYCEIRPTHASFCHVASSWPSKKRERYEEGCVVKNRNEPCMLGQVLEVVGGRRAIDNRALLAQSIFETSCRVFFPHDLDAMAGRVLAEGGQE